MSYIIGPASRNVELFDSDGIVIAGTSLSSDHYVAGSFHQQTLKASGNTELSHGLTFTST